jgi:hypothetical protein
MNTPTEEQRVTTNGLAGIRRVLVLEPARSILFLLTLMGMRACFQVYLYTKGFLNVSADEFSRGIVAGKWAENPHWDSLREFIQTWLPLEKYLNGLILSVWGDVILVPRVTVFLASCVLLCALYGLLRLLFKQFAIAVCGLIFISTQPWYIWLSGTPMLEMYFLSFFFLGFFFIVGWLKEERKGYWLFAGISFCIASGFHVQSWPLINLVHLLVFVFFCRFLWTRHFGMAARTLGYYVLSNAFILGYCIAEYKLKGEFLGFLGTHSAYSKWFYKGYDVGTAEKLLYYPKVVFGNFNLMGWIFVGASLCMFWRKKHRLWKLLPSVLLVLVLIAYSILNLRSGPPSAAPGRYSVFFVLLLTPYIAHGCVGLVGWARKSRHRGLSISAGLLIAVLFTTLLADGLKTSRNFPAPMPADTVAMGHYLDEVLSAEVDEDDITYMVELSYWEFLGVELTAKHYRQVLYDRLRKSTDRTSPSIFIGESTSIQEYLRDKKVRFVVLKDPALVGRARTLTVLRELGSAGRWTLFKVKPIVLPPL